MQACHNARDRGRDRRPLCRSTSYSCEGADCRRPLCRSLLTMQHIYLKMTRDNIHTYNCTHTEILPDGCANGWHIKLAHKSPKHLARNSYSSILAACSLATMGHAASEVLVSISPRASRVDSLCHLAKLLHQMHFRFHTPRLLRMTFVLLFQGTVQHTELAAVLPHGVLTEDGVRT